MISPKEYKLLRYFLIYIGASLVLIGVFIGILWYITVDPKLEPLAQIVGAIGALLLTVISLVMP